MNPLVPRYLIVLSLSKLLIVLSTLQVHCPRLNAEEYMTPGNPSPPYILEALRGAESFKKSLCWQLDSSKCLISAWRVIASLWLCVSESLIVGSFDGRAR